MSSRRKPDELADIERSLKERVGTGRRLEEIEGVLRGMGELLSRMETRQIAFVKSAERSFRTLNKRMEVIEAKVHVQLERDISVPHSQGITSESVFTSVAEVLGYILHSMILLSVHRNCQEYPVRMDEKRSVFLGYVSTLLGTAVPGMSLPKFKKTDAVMVTLSSILGSFKTKGTEFERMSERDIISALSAFTSNVRSIFMILVRRLKLCYNVLPVSMADALLYIDLETVNHSKIIYHSEVSGLIYGRPQRMALSEDIRSLRVNQRKEYVKWVLNLHKDSPRITCAEYRECYENVLD